MHTSITRRDRRAVTCANRAEEPVFVAQALPASVSCVSKCNLPGYVGFFQFLRNFRQRNAFEQTGDRTGGVRPSDCTQSQTGVCPVLIYFDLLQTARN